MSLPPQSGVVWILVNYNASQEDQGLYVVWTSTHWPAQQPGDQPTPRRTELRNGFFWQMRELQWELYWELHWGRAAAGGEFCLRGGCAKRSSKGRRHGDRRGPSKLACHPGAKELANEQHPLLRGPFRPLGPADSSTPPAPTPVRITLRSLGHLPASEAVPAAARMSSLAVQGRL